MPPAFPPTVQLASHTAQRLLATAEPIGATSYFDVIYEQLELDAPSGDVDSDTLDSGGDHE